MTPMVYTVIGTKLLSFLLLLFLLQPGGFDEDPGAQGPWREGTGGVQPVDEGAGATDGAREEDERIHDDQVQRPRPVQDAGSQQNRKRFRRQIRLKTSDVNKELGPKAQA